MLRNTSNAFLNVFSWVLPQLKTIFYDSIALSPKHNVIKMWLIKFKLEKLWKKTWNWMIKSKRNEIIVMFIDLWFICENVFVFYNFVILSLFSLLFLLLWAIIIIFIQFVLNKFIIQNDLCFLTFEIAKNYFVSISDLRTFLKFHKILIETNHHSYSYFSDALLFFKSV